MQAVSVLVLILIASACGSGSEQSPESQPVVVTGGGFLGCRGVDPARRLGVPVSGVKATVERLPSGEVYLSLNLPVESVVGRDDSFLTCWEGRMSQRDWEAVLSRALLVTRRGE